MGEYSVATGKVCGKMLETFINILIFYAYTVAISIALLIVGVLVYTFKESRRDYVNERWGIKYFFNGVRKSGKDSLVLLFIFIPLLNLILAIGVVSAFCTDVGDRL